MRRTEILILVASNSVEANTSGAPVCVCVCVCGGGGGWGVLGDLLKFWSMGGSPQSPHYGKPFYQAMHFATEFFLEHI